jgi:hypothetical protein
LEIHVRNLGRILVGYGALSGLIALVVLIAFGGYDGLFLLDNPFYKRKDIGTIPLDRLLVGVYATLALVLSGPLIAGGWGLLRWKHWARVVAMLAASVNMLSFPIGTGIGLYALWVLNEESVDPLFDRVRADMT